jgi:hypothetical protein
MVKPQYVVRHFGLDDCKRLFFLVESLQQVNLVVFSSARDDLSYELIALPVTQKWIRRLIVGRDWNGDQEKCQDCRTCRRTVPHEVSFR